MDPTGSFTHAYRHLSRASEDTCHKDTGQVQLLLRNHWPDLHLYREAVAMLTLTELKSIICGFESELEESAWQPDITAFGRAMVVHTGRYVLDNSPAELAAQLDGLVQRAGGHELLAVADRVLGIRVARQLKEKVAPNLICEGFTDIHSYDVDRTEVYGCCARALGLGSADRVQPALSSIVVDEVKQHTASQKEAGAPELSEDKEQARVVAVVSAGKEEAEAQAAQLVEPATLERRREATPEVQEQLAKLERTRSDLLTSAEGNEKGFEVSKDVKKQLAKLDRTASKLLESPEEKTARRKVLPTAPFCVLSSLSDVLSCTAALSDAQLCRYVRKRRLKRPSNWSVNRVWKRNYRPGAPRLKVPSNSHRQRAPFLEDFGLIEFYLKCLTPI